MSVLRKTRRSVVPNASRQTSDRRIKLVAKLPLAETGSPRTAYGALVTEQGEYPRIFLTLVNAASFGRVRKVATVAEAIATLDEGLLLAMMLLAQLLHCADVEAVEYFSTTHFRSYALRAARLAERFAVDRARAQDAFVAGLLHDIGELVFALRDSARLATVAAVVAEGSRPAVDVERDYFGSSHAQAGAALLARWGFSRGIVDAVALHHSPGDRRAADVELLAVVHAASAYLEPHGRSGPRLDAAFLASAGLVDHVARWSVVAEQEADEPAP